MVSRDTLASSKLHAALLDGALGILRRGLPEVRIIEPRPTPRRVEFYVRAELRWLLSESVEPFSFLRCCEVLGLDPDAVRARLRSEGILPRRREAILRRVA